MHSVYHNNLVEGVKNMVPAERGVEELIELIKADGRWEEP
jgi:hypothetical protein